MTIDIARRGRAAPRLRPGWLGRPGWGGLAAAVAALVVIPVAMLAVSILRPNTDVWRQQWDTRLPGQITDTLILLIGVVSLSTVLGVSLAWMLSAYQFPGRR